MNEVTEAIKELYSNAIKDAFNQLINDPTVRQVTKYCLIAIFILIAFFLIKAAIRKLIIKHRKKRRIAIQ